MNEKLEKDILRGEVVLLRERTAALELRLDQIRAYVSSSKKSGDDDGLDELLEPTVLEQLEAKAKQASGRVYFDALESEVLHHEDPAHALDELFEGRFDSDKTPEQNLEELRSICPIEVVKYEPDPMGEREHEWLADQALESLEEHLADEYGDLDGNHSFWTEQEQAGIRARLVVAMRYATQTARVWRCHVVARKAYSFEEVCSMLDYRGSTLDELRRFP